MSLEWRALDQSATAAGLTPPKLLTRSGALAGPEDYFLRRFAFEFFPHGTGFASHAPVVAPAGLEDARTSAFSIDDMETTEIDDAFSVERLADGRFKVGVHIAAPTLFFGRDHALETIARERLSTVYCPGGKITMLPEDAVLEATLAAGRRVPALSLYLTIDPETFDVAHADSRIEWITIETNLRLGELDRRLNEDTITAGRVEGAHGDDLLLLWRLASRLKAARGAAGERAGRLGHTHSGVGRRAARPPPAPGTPPGTRRGGPPV